MKIHEHQAKKMLDSYGIPVEKHILCIDPKEVEKGYIDLKSESAVIKAQVHSGGRGKAGGIKFAKNKEEALKYFLEIKGMFINGLEVEEVLISQAVSIKKEYYVSYVIDRNTKSVLLIMSKEGGMEIEEVAKNTPNEIFKFSIDPFVGLPDFLARRYALTLVSDTKQINELAKILQNLYRLFIEKDASLVEINPLVLTNNEELIAIDAKVSFDLNALFRHPDLMLLRKPTLDEEKEIKAKEKGISYVNLDGDIGCMVNGAGLAMSTMDIIKLYGGSPANFLDIGGSSSPEKVIYAMKLLLSDKKVKVVLINIFGGITRCDDVARGLLLAFEQIEIKIPIVVRLTGTNQKEGRKMLEGTKLLVAESMNEAANMAISAIKPT